MLNEHTDNGSIVLFLVAVVLVLAVSCEKKASHETHLLGQDPVIAASVENGTGGVFVEWARNGFRGMTVINAAVRSGLAPISDADMKEITRSVKSADWAALEGPALPGRGKLVNSSNYLTAAFGLGIVKSIYWVIPYPFFESAGGGGRARQFLVDSGLVPDRKEADRFRMAGACLTGSVRHAEVTICSPDTMHFINEPVLLALDEGYLPVYARSRGIAVLEGLKRFMDAMFSRGFRIAGACIGPVAPDQPFDPALSYTRSQMEEALKFPSIMLQEEPPPLWKARDAGDALLQQGDFKRAYAALKASIGEFGPDNGLRTLLACAALRVGKYEEALADAGILCSQSRADCGLLMYLGSLALGKGSPETASRFFQKAVENSPGWTTAEQMLKESRSREKEEGYQKRP